MNLDDLRYRYDELDNIISSIQNLIEEIKDRDYIERLEIIEFEAQDELNEIIPKLEQLEEKEEEEMNREYERSKI